MSFTSDGKYETECHDTCTSKIHGKEIVSISSSSTDMSVVPLWMQTCSNYAHIQDKYGRNALHMVASVGNLEALEWLIKRAGADIDKKDKISGYTALHRAVFFGQIHIARSLISYGADVNLKDHEGMTPLELCNADIPRFNCSYNIQSDPTELFVWGTNTNYTLGSTMEQSRQNPELFEFFRKQKISIMQVSLSTYHSVFLTQQNVIYVCGNGIGGRLGLGHEKSALQPEIMSVRANTSCVQVSSSVDHTLLLMDTGRVMSCGSNENGVLGQKSKFSLYPRHIDYSPQQKFKGVLATRFHSVFYTYRKLFTCGANKGQLGHPPEKGAIIFEPTLVEQLRLNTTVDVKISHVAAGIFATAVRLNNGILHLFYKHEHFKINLKQFDVRKIELIGGGFSENEKRDVITADEKLTIVVLTSTGRIAIVRVNDQGVAQFTRAVFHTTRVIDVHDFALSLSGICFITSCGEAYKSVWKPSSTPLCFKNWEDKAGASSRDDFQFSGNRRMTKGKDATAAVLLEYIKIQRIRSVYLGRSISTDFQGNNFAIIQASPKFDLTAVPEILQGSLNTDMEKFYNEIHVDDGLHDVLFLVDKEAFPVHKVVLASHCVKLYDLTKQNCLTVENDVKGIRICGVSDIVFRQIIQFVYYGFCDLLKEKYYVSTQTDIIKSTIECARKYGLESLCKELRKISISNNVVVWKPGNKILPINRRYNLGTHSNLTDVAIESSDGQVFRAHKCILIARSEYFRSMLFTNLWLEQNSSKPIKLQYSAGCLWLLLEYLYTDSVKRLREDDLDVNELSELLSMSDNLFLERLRSLIEYVLADFINMKNIPYLLFLADRYNAFKLKECSMQFICLNLASVLESRVLESLPLDIMKDISSFYKQLHPTMGLRKIHAACSAPSHNDFHNVMKDVPEVLKVEMEACLLDEEIRKPANKTRHKLRIRSRVSESDSHEAGKLSESLDSPCVSPDSPKKPSSRLSTNIVKHANHNENILKPPIVGKRTDMREVKLNSPMEFPTLCNIGLNEDEGFVGVKHNSEHLTGNPAESLSNDKNQPHVACKQGKKKTKWKSININNHFNTSGSVDSQNVSETSKCDKSRDPKNPWKMSNTENKEFREIVQEEVEKKENLERVTNKSISLMQIEEQAINQLAARYNSPDVEDGVEILTIERLTSTNFAQPTWVNSSSFNNNVG